MIVLIYHENLVCTTARIAKGGKGKAKPALVENGTMYHYPQGLTASGLALATHSLFLRYYIKHRAEF